MTPVRVPSCSRRMILRPCLHSHVTKEKVIENTQNFPSTAWCLFFLAWTHIQAPVYLLLLDPRPGTIRTTIRRARRLVDLHPRTIRPLRRSSPSIFILWSTMGRCQSPMRISIYFVYALNVYVCVCCCYSKCVPSATSNILFRSRPKCEDSSSLKSYSYSREESIIRYPITPKSHKSINLNICLTLFFLVGMRLFAQAVCLHGWVRDPYFPDTHASPLFSPYTSSSMRILDLLPLLLFLILELCHRSVILGVLFTITDCDSCQWLLLSSAPLGFVWSTTNASNYKIGYYHLSIALDTYSLLFCL